MRRVLTCVGIQRQALALDRRAAHLASRQLRLRRAGGAQQEGPRQGRRHLVYRVRPQPWQSRGNMSAERVPQDYHLRHALRLLSVPVGGREGADP